MSPRKALGFALAAVVGVVILWAVVRQTAAGDQPWNAPTGGVILSPNGSLSTIEWQGQSIVLFYPGMWGSSNQHTSNPVTKTFDYTGTLTAKEAKATTYEYRSESSDQFTVNGKTFELSKGRVFVVGAEGAVDQLPFCPLKASAEYAVALRDYLASRRKGRE